MSSINTDNPVTHIAEITLAVRLNGDLTRLAGRARFSMSVPEGSTVEELFTKVGEENPTLAERLGQAIPVVNGRHVSREMVLLDGQEVALLMPVAGGSVHREKRIIIL